MDITTDQLSVHPKLSEPLKASYQVVKHGWVAMSLGTVKDGGPIMPMLGSKIIHLPLQRRSGIDSAGALTLVTRLWA